MINKINIGGDLIMNFKKEEGKGGLGFLGTVFAIIVAILILCVC